MTAATQLRQEGILQGRQEGMQIRNIEIAKNLLSKGLNIKLIHEVTSVRKKLIEKLAKE
jgi:predicted transposase YdaD